jgi:outer membrane protein, heavy metal efflux system
MSMMIKTFLIVFSLAGHTQVLASEKMTLEQFIKEVKAQNLSLKVDSAQASAAKAAAAGYTIPPPMAAITQMQDQSGAASGYEVNQVIPFPTKITNDRSARKASAEAQEAIQKANERDILTKAKLVYFKIWQNQERISLLQEKKAAISQHLKLSTASARSDSFLKVHLLKSESDLDLLENEILEAIQNSQAQIYEAAVFLNKDPKSFDLKVEEMPLSQIPKQEMLRSPVALEAKRLEVESLRARESEGKAAWLPDFSLRYREMGGTQMTPRYSEVMVGATLPFLFFWQPNAESQRASADRMAGEVQLQQDKRKIESETSILFSRVHTLRRQLDLVRDKLLPRAEKRMRLIHNLAPRDMETLIDHREAMESLPDLKLKALELRAKYEEAVAELEKLSPGDLK